MTKRKFAIGVPKPERVKEKVGRVLEKAKFSMKGFTEEDIKTRRDERDLIDTTGKLGVIECVVSKPWKTLSYVQEGAFQGGIVGLDKVIEFNANAKIEGTKPVKVVDALENVAECSLRILGRFEDTLNSVSDLSGKRVITSYPKALKAWLADNGVTDCIVKYSDGGLEDAVERDMADFICDIVESGNTAKAYGLEVKVDEPLFKSQAVLVQTPEFLDAEDSMKLSAVFTRIAFAANGPAEVVSLPQDNVTIENVAVMPAAPFLPEQPALRARA